jgi:ribosomal protein S18 acetylase RimI-like enzyme
VSELVVRQATAEDAAAIAGVHIQAWRETYARLVEPGELDALSVDVRAARWGSMLGSGSAVWVSVLASEVVGFASLDTSRTDRPRPLELGALYVLAEHHGSGAGQQLLDSAIGNSPAFLFVAEDNPRATRFYERNGFAFDGVTESYPLVRTPIVSRRMVR